MLLKSRKFWLMIADLVFSCGVYFVGKYAGPEASADILWLIGILQPVIISLITGIAIEDSARFKADGAVASAEIASGNG